MAVLRRTVSPLSEITQLSDQQTTDLREVAGSAIVSGRQVTVVMPTLLTTTTINHGLGRKPENFILGAWVGGAPLDVYCTDQQWAARTDKTIDVTKALGGGTVRIWFY